MNFIKIISLIPVRTSQTIHEKELSFTSISADSLEKLLRNKPVLNVKLQAALPIQFTKENTPQSASAIQLDFQFNPIFKSSDIDSTGPGIQRDIEPVKLDISKAQQEQIMYQNQKRMLLEKFKNLQSDLQSNNLADREFATKNFPAAKAEFENLKPPLNQLTALNLRLNFLQSKLHIKETQSINGFISYFIIN